VRHRIGVAGGKGEIFRPAALALLHELSDGNPALVNQLCDNALVEAFSEDQRCVDRAHVLAARRSISGEAEHAAKLTNGNDFPVAHAVPRPAVLPPNESLLIIPWYAVPAASASPRERLNNLHSRLSEAFLRVRAVGRAHEDGVRAATSVRQATTS
jgi:hypothetical protein